MAVNILDGLNAEDLTTDTVLTIAKEGLAAKEKENTEAKEAVSGANDLLATLDSQIQSQVKTSGKVTQAGIGAIEAQAEADKFAAEAKATDIRQTQIEESTKNVTQREDVISLLEKDLMKATLRSQGMKPNPVAGEPPIPMTTGEKIASFFVLDEAEAEVTRLTNQIGALTGIRNQEIVAQGQMFMNMENAVKNSPEYLAEQQKVIDANAVVKIGELDLKQQTALTDSLATRYNIKKDQLSNIIAASQVANETEAAGLVMGLIQFTQEQDKLNSYMDANKRENAAYDALSENLTAAMQITSPELSGAQLKAAQNDIKIYTELTMKGDHKGASLVSKRNPLVANAVNSIDWDAVSTESLVNAGPEAWKATSGVDDKAKFLSTAYNSLEKQLTEKSFEKDSELYAVLNKIVDPELREAERAKLVREKAIVASAAELSNMQTNSIEFTRQRVPTSPNVRAYSAKLVKEDISKGEVYAPKTTQALEVASTYFDKNIGDIKHIDSFINKLGLTLAANEVVVRETSNKELEQVAQGVAKSFYSYKQVTDAEQLATNPLYKVSADWKLKADVKFGGVNMRGKDLTNPADVLFILKAQKLVPLLSK